MVRRLAEDGAGAHVPPPLWDLRLVPQVMLLDPWEGTGGFVLVHAWHCMQSHKILHILKEVSGPRLCNIAEAYTLAQPAIMILLHLSRKLHPATNKRVKNHLLHTLVSLPARLRKF